VRRHLAHNLRLDRPLCRESLRDHLGLEPDRRLGQQRGVHTTRTHPRLGSLLVLHAENFQALHVHLAPVLATGDVGIDKLKQVRRNGRQLRVGDNFREVGIELVIRTEVIFGLKRDLHTIDTHRHALGVFYLDLDQGLGSKHTTHTLHVFRVKRSQALVDVGSHCILSQ
jgi:hypothetical protein